MNNNLGNTHWLITWNWGTSNNNGTLLSTVTSHGGPNYPQFLTFNESFTYDGVNRLTSVTDSGGWNRYFTVDQYGNMYTSANYGIPLNGLAPTTYVFNPATNQMSNTPYYAVGNQTVFGSYTLSYDAENRQTQATESPSYGGGQAIYVYDGDGRRVEKIIGSQTNTYVYL